MNGLMDLVYLREGESLVQPTNQRQIPFSTLKFFLAVAQEVSRRDGGPGLPARHHLPTGALVGRAGAQCF